jgi:hypothetical protein
MIDSNELEKLLPLLKEGNKEAQRTLFDKCYPAVSGYVETFPKQDRLRGDCFRGERDRSTFSNSLTIT